MEYVIFGGLVLGSILLFGVPLIWGIGRMRRSELPDAELARAIEDRLAHTEELDPRSIEVRVSHGEATLRGTVTRMIDCDIARGVAASIKGVTSVRSDLRVESRV